jgi:peptidyl-prolyl cis-trans isomerase SurA
LRRLMFGAGIAIVIAIAMPDRADAQAVAIVNGDPITAFDVEQRAKLIQLSSHQTKPRNEVVEELINEKIKTQLLRRFGIDGIDKDVDNAYANMARRMRATPKQFSENLEKSGIKTETLKSRIKADLIWSQIIRSKYQSAFQFSDQDINSPAEGQEPRRRERGRI